MPRDVIINGQPFIELDWSEYEALRHAALIAEIVQRGWYREGRESNTEAAHSFNPTHKKGKRI